LSLDSCFKKRLQVRHGTGPLVFLLTGPRRVSYRLEFQHFTSTLRDETRGYVASFVHTGIEEEQPTQCVGSGSKPITETARKSGCQWVMSATA
jgi:hypothetical protein